MELQPQRISGVQEWAKASGNIAKGCQHGCRYCYARWEAVYKYETLKSEAAWTNMVVNEKAVNKRWNNVGGTVMFPTVHDITPNILEPCLITIGHILDAGNKVLIVSKPHLDCIEAICEKFEAQKDKILFRFTIGADDDKVLGYWEPNAPSFAERLRSLQFAYDKGFASSVSIEPMLDKNNIIRLVRTVEPIVTDSIWIGKMNAIGKRVKTVTEEDRQQVRRIIEGQTDKQILSLYQALKDNPKVKWKESIKEVVGLPLAQEAGLDR